MTNTVREQILGLARQHGLGGGEVQPIEQMAEAISALSDSAPATDEVRRVLVRLRQAGVMTPAQGHEWLMKLADEEDAAAG